MEDNNQFVDELPRIGMSKSFCFDCHPAVPCFNACCADLDLQLSPYDILQLREALSLPSRELLACHTTLEPHGGSNFPLVSLRMRDDEAKTCPFVSKAGCSVYQHRPGACRAYPIGRGAGIDDNGELFERFVLVRERHCRGFEQEHRWSVSDWLFHSGLKIHFELADRCMRLLARLCNEKRKLDHELAEVVWFALYHIDELGPFLAEKQWFAQLEMPTPVREKILNEELARLHFAIDWVETLLFGGERIGAYRLATQ